MKHKIIGAAVALALCLGQRAFAQVAPPQPPGTPALAGFVTVSVTNSASAGAALPGSTQAFPALTLKNSGTKDAFCAFGGSGVAATTSSTPIRSGDHVNMWAGTGTYVSCITGGTDTTTVTVYQANGPVM